MSFPRYGSYKDSGVEWLGEVPGHWDVKRLKQICDVFPSNVDKKTYENESPVLLCNYTDVYYNEQITPHIDFMAATASADQIKKFTLRKGDTIITKDSETADDIAIAAYVPQDLSGVICGYHLSMVRPRETTCGAFVKRLFDSIYVKSCCAVSANGLTRVGLGQYALDNLEMPFPPKAEQKTITAFLDRETAKIDELIAEQQRLIELLKEKRQAVISHAVTKGLNPDAPMKDSCIEWLGKVPEHWEVYKLTKCVKSIVDYRGKTPNKVDDGVFLLTARNIKEGAIDYETSQEFVSPSEYEEIMRRGKPSIGDLVFTMEAPLGQVANIDRTDVAIAQRIIKMQGHDANISNYFLKYWFMGTYSQSQLASLATGSTALGLKASKLGQIDVCLPPKDEQISIVGYLDNQTARFDCLTAEAKTAITLLQEHRNALISAAVTGKIDVRNYTIRENEK